jgi:hypothetical protein
MDMFIAVILNWSGDARVRENCAVRIGWGGKVEDILSFIFPVEENLQPLDKPFDPRCLALPNHKHVPATLTKLSP